jgi:hypothetical protein
MLAHRRPPIAGRMRDERIARGRPAYCGFRAEWAEAQEEFEK